MSDCEKCEFTQYPEQPAWQEIFPDTGIYRHPDGDIYAPVNMALDAILSAMLKYCEDNGHYFDVAYHGFAEPGYADPDSGLCVLGNWNNVRQKRRRYPKEVAEFLVFPTPEGIDSLETYVDDTMQLAAEVFGACKIEVLWDDEWVQCSNCSKLVRTSPDCYAWTPNYWEGDGDPVCHECICSNPEEYLEALEGDPDKANTISDLNLSDWEYVAHKQEFQTGYYGGQNADPHVIAKSLRKLGVERFIFEIVGQGQFDMTFNVWVHKSEYPKVDGVALESAGADPAEEAKKALRNVPTPKPGEAVIVIL